MNTKQIKVLKRFRDMRGYEECPYNPDFPTRYWVKLANDLHRCGLYVAEYTVTRRLMFGRDRTYTKVVKLGDGTLALA